MNRPTWTGAWDIPRRVALPGVRVRVHVVPPEDAEKMQFTDGAWRYSCGDDGSGSALVLIDGRLPLPVQRYVLLHELQHVLTDLVDVSLEKFPEQVQTKSMAAHACRVPMLPPGRPHIPPGDEEAA